MDAIFNRRSIRKYTDQIIPEEFIEKILRAGMAAPSANNEQPWHFIVIDDRDILNEIPKYHPYAQMLKEANRAILVCGDRTVQKFDGYWIQDCAAATQNMLLMAHELGLGAVWLGIYPRDERVKLTKELFCIPEHITPLSLISLGFPAEKKQPSDRYKPERIHYNRW